MPTVSVLLPCYNAASTLGEALNSLLNQTFPDFEVIAVNDGSDDLT
ncbi:MAG: glycosyltransferase, partial [Anaerolineales bacterium]|nr:glycosyltransferase [Anaerolineales bacterium]